MGGGGQRGLVASGLALLARWLRALPLWLSVKAYQPE